MENVKHTPGPWVVETAIDEKGQIQITGTKDLRDSLDDAHYPSFENVAKLDFIHPVSDKFIKAVNAKTMANARLIACAPELLDLVACLAASLEDANKYIHHKATWDTKGAAVQYSQFGGETIEKSQKVLAKVRGA